MGDSRRSLSLVSPAPFRRVLYRFIDTSSYGDTRYLTEYQDPIKTNLNGASLLLAHRGPSIDFPLAIFTFS